MIKHLVRMDVASHPSLGSLLDEALLRHASKDALIEAQRKRETSRWTYRDVDRVANQVTARLQSLGIGPGDRVAILMSNQPRWLVTAVAVFRRGAVLVPLDYKLEPDQQADLVTHAKPALVVTEYAIFRTLPALEVDHLWVSEAPESEELSAVRRWEHLDPEATAPEPEPRTADDVATIVYSSGTGGRAKGCMLQHRAYLAQLEALLERFPMEPGDRYFSILPTNHAIDFMVGFVGPLVCGATVVHQRTLRPEMLRWTMQRFAVTHMAVVPLLLTAFKRNLDEAIEARPGWQQDALRALTEVNARLTERGPAHALSRRLLKPIHDAFGGHLKLMFCGGAFTDRAIAESFYRLGIPVVIGYGLTEACTVITVNGLAPFRADTVGAPVPGVELRIEAPDASGVGEVCVRGPTLMLGYVDDPALTAETIREGWLYTGDLGWIDASGHLHLVGRLKDVIVTAGGKNVYPEDIEHAFADLDVEELGVFAANTLWPSRTMTGEELVVVLRPHQSAASAELVDALVACNRTLPDYKRVAGFLVWNEPFPRTASMKLKRSAFVREVATQTDRATLVRITG